ncbi:MAG: hypothetical protein EOO06_02080 [Chitinophagaceae bacterium]|nr:MAG: hypothetical protein EOO06_02080 [Chitinophagaceae bacterium]
MDELVTGIKIFAGDASLALNLYYYIPAAFCRIVYPEPEYSNEIVLAKSGKTIRTHSLADDKIFKVVMEESSKSYARDNTADKIVSILVHSAEFDALNKALHAGSSLQDLGFSPSVYNL